MACGVAQFNLLKAVGGKSGLRPCCTTTPTVFFLGECSMNCKHETCSLLNISLIPLTQGKYAIVDTEDYDWLMQWRWFAVKNGRTYYAGRNTYLVQTGGLKRTRIHMHRVIMQTPLGSEIDHCNHNGLDNRKCNMRICTHAENLQNQRQTKHCTSKYKGQRTVRRICVCEYIHGIVKNET